MAANPVPFLKESVQELKKVSWPGRKEIVASTLVVLAVSAVFVVLVKIMDEIIHFALNFILK